MSKADQVILDTNRFKTEIVKIIDRAIQFGASPYTDTLKFSPPLTPSNNVKWRLFWRAIFDSLDIIYRQKGFLVNIQKCVYNCSCVSSAGTCSGHYMTVSGDELPHVDGNSFRIYWKAIESEDDFEEL